MDGGAQEAMQYCVLSEKRNREKIIKNSDKINKINYIKKNKIAVEKGLVNAREQANGIKELEKAYLIEPPTKTKSDSNLNGCNKNTQANYQKQAKITQNLKDNDTKQYKKDWQMNKWKKIGSNLNTFRSDKLKQDSMNYHYETMNTRQGIFGHGNYIDQASKIQIPKDF